MNNSLEYTAKPKLINSFSQLCTSNPMNKSFQYPSDNESDNSLSNQQLLLMQLKQLRRQNIFLKKKIQQLKSHNPLPSIKLSKRNSLNYIKTLKHRNSILSNMEDKKQSTISCVIKQVQNILKSVAMVYKVEVDEKVWYNNNNNNVNSVNSLENTMSNKSNSNNNIDITNTNNNSNNKIDIFSSQKLFLQQQKHFNLSISKKLQHISLSPQQTRYQSLLSIFSQFYSNKKQIQQYLKSRLTYYIEQTLSISQQLFQKISSKQQQKSMMKSSNTYSLHYSHMDDQRGNENIVGNNIISNSSINNNNNWLNLKDLKQSNCDLKDSLTNDTWKKIDKINHNRNVRYSTIDPIIREDNQ